MCKKKVIATIAASAFSLVLFHVSVEQAGAELAGAPVAEDRSLHLSHGAADPTPEHNHDHHNATDHEHFGTFLKPKNTHRGDLTPAFVAGYLPPSELPPTRVSWLFAARPQRLRPGPPLFLLNRTLRL